MTEPSPARTLRGPRTLRTQLVVGLASLVTVAVIVIGAVAVTVLHGILLGQVDDSLANASARGRAVIGGPGPGSGDGPMPPPPGERPDSDRAVLAPAQAEGTVFALVIDGQTESASVVDADGSAHDLDAASAATLASLPADGTARTINLGGDLGTYRVLAETTPNDAVVVAGLPLAPVRDTTLELALVVAGAAAAAMVLGALAGRVLVRRALGPLERVSETAERVSSLPLDQRDVSVDERVPDADTDPRTEVGRVGGSLNRLLERVASALAARAASEAHVRQFVADASHELRTPIASIRGYAELTRRHDAELPEEVSYAVGRIDSESRRMSALVDDLLLLARLDEGRPLRHDRVDLSELVVAAISDAHAAAPDHVWELDLPDEPVFVTGDRDRLHQVVANLLTNARVHTPAGTRVELVLGTDDGAAVVGVSDNGPGIDPAVLPTIFERFARADSSRSRTAGSTGLGLAIVQAVVAAHGGTVGVDSRPGSTRFAVRLPAEPAITELAVSGSRAASGTG